MKKRIMGIMLALTMALACIPQAVRVSADTAEDDIISTAREISKTDSFDYDPSQYRIEGYYWYATRLSLNKGDRIMIKCGRQNTENIDMYINVYELESDGTLSYINRLDNDNYKGSGEKATLDAAKDVTYYIVYGIYASSSGMGNCHVEIEDLSDYKDITESFKSAEPYGDTVNTEIELGNGGLWFIEDIGIAYAKTYCFEAAKGDGIVASICNVETHPDTVIALYYEDESGDIKYLCMQDLGNYLDRGELITEAIPETGRYYIVFAGFDDTVTGRFDVEFNHIKCQMKSLDFTLHDRLPEHKDGDLWSWDDDNRTLTLKDGFCYNTSDEETPAICLPKNSTILVEGSANITSCLNSAIISEGGLTIKGTSDNSNIRTESEHSAIEFRGGNTGLNISNCDLTIRTQDCGLIVNGDLKAEDSDIEITASYDGIAKDDDYDTIKIQFDNSRLSIKSRGSCMFLYNSSFGDTDTVELKDCDTYLKSYGDSGIYMEEDGIGSLSEVTVKGGRLIIDSYDATIKTGKCMLEDVNFNLSTESKRLQYISDDEFSFPGEFRLYDENGKLLYEGGWDALKLYKDLILSVDGASVTHAVTAHEHTFGDWKYDETSHWKLCTDKNCTSIDYGKSETLANHEFTTLDNGDRVCECGYTIKSGAKPGDSRPGDDTEIPKDVKAGNGSTLLVWFGISACVMLTAVVCIRRKKAIQ